MAPRPESEEPREARGQSTHWAEDSQGLEAGTASVRENRRQGWMRGRGDEGTRSRSRQELSR